MGIKGEDVQFVGEEGVAVLRDIVGEGEHDKDRGVREKVESSGCRLDRVFMLLLVKLINIYYNQYPNHIQFYLNSY